MINILLPVAGVAKRFLDAGFDLPKPLLPINGVPMIKLAIDSLIPPGANRAGYRLIFVVRQDHCVNHDIANTLRTLFTDFAVEVVVIDEVTQGTLCTCLLAAAQIDNDDPLVIYTPDVCFEGGCDLISDFAEATYDGLLLTFKANSQDHSYVAIDNHGLATKTAEKVVISGDALVGVYGFRTGRSFLAAGREAVATGMKVRNEYYVAPIFNLLIAKGQRIITWRTSKMYVLGTPEDVEFYTKHVARYYKPVKLALCCDHSGFQLKQALTRVLTDMGVGFIDFGSYSDKDSDHHDSLRPCVEHLLANTNTMGIASCHTGQGFNIAANKIAGIRSALIYDEYSAIMSRRHNAANFFCLPSRLITPADLPTIAAALLGHTFDGGRHATRIMKTEKDSLFIK